MSNHSILDVSIVAPSFDEPFYDPTDPAFANGSQWYLDDDVTHEASLNIKDVWDEYRGQGIKIAIVDDGIDYDHPDLAANSDPSLGGNFVTHQTNAPTDGSPYLSGDNHGTTVAGVLAADDDGSGLVGVAPDSTIAGLRIGYGSNHSTSHVLAAFTAAKNFDIVNNSWGYGGFFYDNYSDPFSHGLFGNPFVNIHNAIIDAVDTARNGLGNIWVYAAGNDGAIGDNVNYHAFVSSPHTIAVGGHDTLGFDTTTSTPGAAVLISAPSQTILTTDRSGVDGDLPGDTAVKSGTSYAAPIASGVIALMLEANPNLGYRDVQEILTLSGEYGDPTDSAWKINGSNNWNGGGRHVSDELGFGTLDAHNAVRLAETWTQQSTYSNLVEHTISSSPFTFTLDQSTFTQVITVGNLGIDLDQVVVGLDIDHSRIGEVRVTLTSPDGTVSKLIDLPGGGDGKANSFIEKFELTSVQYWGEDIAGDWILTVSDNDYLPNDGLNDTGILSSWDITFMGDTATDDDTYFYSDEYALFASDTSRQTINDSAGIDTLNFAMMDVAVTFDMNAGVANDLFGFPITIASGVVIENFVGSDGDDDITGNDAANYLRGMRGNDTLQGNGGDDTIDGGAGLDTVTYDGLFAEYLLTLNPDGTVTVEDAPGFTVDGTDLLVDIEYVQFADFFYTVGDVPPPPGGNEDKPPVVLPGPATHLGTFANAEYLNGTQNDDILDGGGGSWDTLDGKGGDDAYILLFNSNVTIKDTFGQGNDTAYVDFATFNSPYFIENIILLDDGFDVFASDIGNYIDANDNANVIGAKGGNDRIVAWGGDDRITTGTGNDLVNGGLGNDTVVLSGVSANFLITEQADGSITVIDTVGDQGFDRLIHVENLEFDDTTIQVTDLITDPDDLASLGIISHPSGYAAPVADVVGNMEGYQQINGTSGDNVLSGGGGDGDRLAGLSGNDTYIVEDSVAVIQEYASAGFDTAVISTVHYSTNADVELFYMMYGSISLTAGSNSSTIHGNDLDNQINTGAGNDTVFAYGGNDSITGGSGNETVDGGTGFDVVNYTGLFADYTLSQNPDGSINVDGTLNGDGIDTVINVEQLIFSDQVFDVGTPIPDPDGGGDSGDMWQSPPLPTGNEVTGTTNSFEVINGDASDNVMRTGGGIHDQLVGGAGNDSYIVEDNQPVIIRDTWTNDVDTVYSGATTAVASNNIEYLFLLDSALNGNGNSGSNHIEGNDKANTLDGRADNDIILGWDSDDRIIGGSGNDFIDGGIGSGDTAVFSGPQSNYEILEHADGSVTVLDLVGTDGTDRLIHVEFLEFGGQPAIATPDAIADPDTGSTVAPLSGPGGVVAPIATKSGTLASFDTVFGTTGNDVLAGGGGDLDTLNGGAGDDSYIIESSSTRIQEYVFGGNDTAYIFASDFSSPAEIETYHMMYGSLVLSVSGSNSTAFGNDHDNQISATSGTNVFYGGDGDDTIVGGSGLDTVVFDGDIADFIITQGAGATIDVAHAASGAPGTDLSLIHI